MNKYKKKKRYTLYDFNKHILSQSPPYSDDQLTTFKQDLTTWDNNLMAQFYMLLNKENRYYTLLYHVASNTEDNISNTLGDGISILLNELGYDIIAHDYVADDNHYEVWVKNSNSKTFVYLLFPFDKGVVRYG